VETLAAGGGKRKSGRGGPTVYIIPGKLRVFPEEIAASFSERTSHFEQRRAAFSEILIRVWNGESLTGEHFMEKGRGTDSSLDKQILLGWGV
jgi:hypothetical protein